MKKHRICEGPFHIKLNVCIEKSTSQPLFLGARHEEHDSRIVEIKNRVNHLSEHMLGEKRKFIKLQEEKDS